MADEANDTGEDHNANQTDDFNTNEGKESEAVKGLLGEVTKLREQFREVKEQNQYLKGLVETNVQRAVPKDTTDDDEIIDKLDPDAKKAVERLIERSIESKSKNLVGAVDMLISRADVGDFKEAAGKNYKKYVDRVENEYQALFRAGKPMTRAMIYKHLRAEDIDSGRVKIEDHSADDIQERERVDASVHSSLNIGSIPKGGKLAPNTKFVKPSEIRDPKKREEALKKMEKDLADFKF